MANGGGGLIIFGCGTKCADVSPQESVDSINPFDKGLLDVERYHKILNEWVVPNIVGISIVWHESNSKPGKGIVTLEIPPAAALLAPYLVKFTLAPDKKRQGSQFSHHVRSFGHNHPSSAEYLQAQLRIARQFPDIGPRLDSIEAQLARITDANAQRDSGPAVAPPPQLAGIADVEVVRRIRQAQITVDRAGRSVFVLVATPANGVCFERLFSSTNEPVVASFDNLASTRKDGFSIEAYQPSTIVDSRLRRRMEPGFYLLELWQDGLYLALGPGDQQLLARQRASTDHLLINSLVLAEATYDFAVQAQSLFSFASPSPTQLNLSISLDNMMPYGKPVVLSNGRVGNHFVFAQSKSYNQAQLVAETTAEFSTYDAGCVAFKLVGAIYNHFGYNHDQMPYIEKGQERISPKSLFEMP